MSDKETVVTFDLTDEQLERIVALVMRRIASDLRTNVSGTTTRVLAALDGARAVEGVERA